MVCHGPIAQVLQQYANASRGQGKTVPDARKIISNGLLQLKAFLATPHAPGWSQLATFVTYYPLQMLASQRTVHLHTLQNALEGWRPGKAFSPLKTEENGNWVFNDKTGLNQDLISYMTVEDAVSNRQSQVITLARLGDTEAETTGSDFNERWRRFLACLNLYQFSENFLFWASSECETGIAPEIPIQVAEAVSEDWKPILDEILPSLKSYIQELANAELPLPDSLPVIEYFNEQIEDDAFAELAWPKLDPPIALIAGDQEDFASEWQQQGWIVVTPDDLQAKGITYLIDLLTSNKSGS